MITVNNLQLNKDLLTILTEVKSTLTNGKLSTIRPIGSDIQVTCPFHANGHERRPSCYIRVEDGVFHCFTDGMSGGIGKFIAGCMDTSVEYAENMLLKKYCDVTQKPQYNLSSIDLTKEEFKATVTQEELDKLKPYHPYMTKRKISDRVIEKFELKYDPTNSTIVFPVRDKYGRLEYLTRRSIEGKNFHIDSGTKKEIYLLYNIIKENIKEVYICESQINALVCESYGKHAVATFGAGCPDNQIADLNNTGVLHYIIAFDPDKAGLAGIRKLCKKLNKFVSVMVLPKGKDVGDLTKDEFDSCPILEKEDFLANIPEYYN